MDIIWKVIFFDEAHRFVLEKDVDEGKEIYFSEEEFNLIKIYGFKYAVCPGNKLVEEQIEKLFNITKLR